MGLGLVPSVGHKIMRSAATPSLEQRRPHCVPRPSLMEIGTSVTAQQDHYRSNPSLRLPCDGGEACHALDISQLRRHSRPEVPSAALSGAQCTSCWKKERASIRV